MKLKSLGAAIIAIAIVLSILFLRASGHEERYMISIRHLPDWVKPPIEIAGFKVRGKEVQSGVFFAADPGYFKDLVVVVKNVSNRRIVYAEAAISFAQDANGDSWLADLDIGQGADYQASLNPDGAELNLQPGGTVELSVAEETARVLAHDVETIKGLPSTILRRVEVRPTAAVFSRDELFRGIDYFKRDPADYTRWKVANPTDLQIQRRAAIERDRNDFKMQKAAFKPAPKSFLGCGFTQDNMVDVCNTPCPDCTYIQTCTRDETPGLRIRLTKVRCTKLINGQRQNCACTNPAVVVDPVTCK